MHENQQRHIIRPAIGAHLKVLAIAHCHTLQRGGCADVTLQQAGEIQAPLTAQLLWALGENQHGRDYKRDDDRNGNQLQYPKNQ